MSRTECTTPARSSATPTVEDYTHPDFCDLALCEPNPAVPGWRPNGLHHSVAPMWPVQGGEVEASVSLLRSDDYDPADGRNHAESMVFLELRQYELCRPGRASAWLDPDEAEAIAKLLTMYAARCRRQRHHDQRNDDRTAEELR